MVKVLIVEDHPEAAYVLRKAVAKGLGCTSIDLVTTIKHAQNNLFQYIYDFILLDLQLPDGHGLKLINAIRQNNAAATIVVTTIFDDDESLFEALRLGAHGYLLKGHSEEEITDFLRKTLNGYPPLSPNIAQSVLSYFRSLNSSGAAEIKESGLKDLTEREQEIFVLVAKGYSVKEVSELLGIANNTVSAHVKNVYRKLNLHNRAEATAMAVAMNLYQP